MMELQWEVECATMGLVGLPIQVNGETRGVALERGPEEGKEKGKRGGGSVLKEEGKSYGEET